jgi:hypothetical protein
MDEKRQLNILSLGAGVQSSTMALMAAHGEITPMPDACIFSDTGAEPDSVYRYLDWLETVLPFPVHRVSYGDLTEDSLRPRKRVKDSEHGAAGESYMRRLIPVFGIMPNGEKTAAIGRKCTAEYKVKPIVKKVKELAGITRGQKEVTVTQWIGISYDEIQRMRDSDVPAIKHRWPLVEMEIHRHQCKEWMLEKGYPEPPRSACYYCPFHSNDEWRNLRDKDPVHFEKAVSFEKELRQSFKDNDPAMKMEIYLHNSCEPLGEIDFDSDEDKGQLTWDFQSECSGMCGV